MPDRNTEESWVPRATYRLQLTENQGFRFVAQLAPYLAKLGVSHCYLSPYLKTRPHSAHGYDVIDHSRLNPELGDDAAYDLLCRTLDDHGLRQLLDIVPNHIGVMGSDNRWWLDVLENGQASRYADYFDIDWRPVKAELANKVLVPVLGDHYGNVLLAGNLVLDFEADAGELSVVPSLLPLVEATPGPRATREEAERTRLLRVKAAELVLRLEGPAGYDRLIRHLPKGSGAAFEPDELGVYAGQLAAMSSPPAQVRADLDSYLWWRRVVAIFYLEQAGALADAHLLEELAGSRVPTVGEGWARRDPPQDTVGKVAEAAVKALRERLERAEAAPDQAGER